jgi:exportin-1
LLFLRFSSLTGRSLVCLEVVNNFANAGEPSVSNAFFQQYYLSIVQDVFFVLTDTDHKSGFKLQSALLARMFQLVELNAIQTPLFDPSQVSDPSATNAMFLKEYTANLLKNAFPHVQPYVFYDFYYHPIVANFWVAEYKFRRLLTD